MQFSNSTVPRSSQLANFLKLSNSQSLKFFNFQTIFFKFPNSTNCQSFQFPNFLSNSSIFNLSNFAIFELHSPSIFPTCKFPQTFQLPISQILQFPKLFSPNFPILRIVNLSSFPVFSFRLDVCTYTIIRPRGCTAHVETARREWRSHSGRRKTFIMQPLLETVCLRCSRNLKKDDPERTGIGMIRASSS